VVTIDTARRERSRDDPPPEATETRVGPEDGSDFDPEPAEAEEERDVVESAYEARRRGEVLSPEDLMLLLDR
jgi:hypothetical protein